MNDVKIYFENETDTTIDAAILDNMKRVIEKTVAEEYDGRSFEDMYNAIMELDDETFGKLKDNVNEYKNEYDL